MVPCGTVFAMAMSLVINTDRAAPRKSKFFIRCVGIQNGKLNAEGAVMHHLTACLGLVCCFTKACCGFDEKISFL